MLADLDNMTVEELAGRLRVVVAAGIEDAADGVAADGVVYCSRRSSRKLTQRTGKEEARGSNGGGHTSDTARTTTMLAHAQAAAEVLEVATEVTATTATSTATSSGSVQRRGRRC
jgi:hypothetical protein